ncbi:MAG: TatD family hydrolase, partial [Sandaracinaceae bacterium]|nr:TatD family hydrolase [Sandaracinaceae bacterium]
PEVLPEIPEERLSDALMGLEKSAVELGAVAIGECGLDGHTAKCFGIRIEHQLQVLSHHLEVATRLGLPLIVHVLGAHGAALAFFESQKAIKVPLIIHAFNGPKELIPRWLRLGAFFGIGPSITWSKARRPQESARALPLNRILIETDAPWTWVEGNPQRSGEPKEARLVLNALASLRGIEAKELEKCTTRNTLLAFSKGFESIRATMARQALSSEPLKN